MSFCVWFYSASMLCVYMSVQMSIYILIAAKRAEEWRIYKEKMNAVATAAALFE